MRARAVRIRGQIFTDPTWHTDALRIAMDHFTAPFTDERRAFLDAIDDGTELIELGFVNDDGTFEGMDNDNNDARIMANLSVAHPRFRGE